MALAKCADCGEELIAEDDGQPYWCTECSTRHDQKEGIQNTRRHTRKRTIIKPQYGKSDLPLEGFSGFLKGEQGEWVRVDKILIVVPVDAFSDTGDSDYSEGYSEHSIGIASEEGQPMHCVWRMSTDRHSHVMILLWRDELMKAIMTLAHDPASTAAKQRVERVLRSIYEDTQEREHHESNPLLRDQPATNPSG